MKKIFLLLFLLLFAIAGWIGRNAYTFYTSFSDSIPAVTPTPAPLLPAKTADGYQYDYVIVSTPSAVSLIENFTAKKDAQTLMLANGCSSAINGGFYDTSNRPLGLFYTDGHAYGEKRSSSLMNGFLWVDTSENAVIASEIPSAPYRFAVQSGPLLLFNENPLPLSIHSDTHARRMIAAKTLGNSLIFLTVYTADSVFDGPLLGNLPDIVKNISTKEHLDMTEAINLDGGGASAFYHEDTALAELTSAGSIFCIK